MKLRSWILPIAEWNLAFSTHFTQCYVPLTIVPKTTILKNILKSFSTAPKIEFV